MSENTTNNLSEDLEKLVENQLNQRPKLNDYFTISKSISYYDPESLILRFGESYSELHIESSPKIVNIKYPFVNEKPSCFGAFSDSNFYDLMNYDEIRLTKRFLFQFDMV